MQVGGDWELPSLEFFQTDSTLAAVVRQELTPIPGDAVKAVATYPSCVLLPGIQGTSQAFGGLGVFILYPGSKKRDNTEEMPGSEEQELLNTYSVLTAQLFMPCHSAPKSS